ncbi:MAG: DNA primase [Candidatus Yanofskybacteria bacterium RIFCSPHIGHO2_02_FULL_38_22b]|uniref:DNA primase n=1 Tax=Candidatus Yanofskybacteria bacterium RIFCSPHIGHO2_02_FULL_38_22b TaxID=1802673 RepID=A0A1F8F4X3_9BACT|nr:MAG: DNA primase [Candidatus Yanofskybacteria bacterium RIFCSPHIGHO2_02_FULL_38_22b]OGN20282.1 MAG: DNA primase [Candidatus Yanofskybacteria bacterium RIFCSPLOWO2_01_FULL_39_28]
MSDNIAKIKERLSVVDVISGYIKVQKAGNNFKARCPFHNEKTPSFYISPERQIWHCFGCQKGGDIFGFVKEMEGVEFGDALRILAQKAGVKLEKFDPSVQDAKQVLYEICETAARFFEKQLHHSSTGKTALDYLKDREMSEQSIREFRLGFVPEGWRNLSQFLYDCGYKDQDIIDAGLSLKKEGGKDIYDRFRSRIIFPVADVNDQIVGFTGRVFGDNHPADVGKYINTPQTLLYDKSRILYGLNKAKMETRQKDSCLLVEGNIDVIMSYQAGVKNVAGTSGTALTPSHLQLLQRFTNNLNFCFDTDQAGLTATRRGIGLALSQNFNINIVHIQEPDCKDPADYIQKFACLPDGQGQKWEEKVKTAKPVIDFYFDKLKSELDLNSVSGKKALISNLGPLLKRLSSRVEKDHWVSRLASVLKTKEESINADILTIKDDLEIFEGHNLNSNNQIIIPSIQSSQDNILCSAILAVVFRNPVVFRSELSNLDINHLDTLTAETVMKLKNYDLDKFNFNEFIKQFDEATAMKLEFSHLKSQELLKDFSEEDLKSEFNRLKISLEHKSTVAQLTILEFDIKEAESNDNKEKLKILLTQFNKLTQKTIKNNNYGKEK